MWTVGDLAEAIGAACEGDPQRPVVRVGLSDTADERTLIWVDRGPIPDTEAGTVICGDQPVPEGVIALRHPHPRLGFARAAQLLHPEPPGEGRVHPLASVATSARVHPTADVGPFAVVAERAAVGARTVLGPHAVIGEETVVGEACRIGPHVVIEHADIGDRVRIAAGTVIGSDGFGFVPTDEGPERVPQLGRVVIEDGVCIGANTCIDRGALGETRIGRGAALDNLVQVGHGATIGPGSLLAAFAGLAGRARLGARTLLGARAGVVEGVTVGEGARLAALASASKDVPAGATMGGSPARPHRSWLRELAALRQLPGMLRRRDRETE